MRKRDARAVVAVAILTVAVAAGVANAEQWRSSVDSGWIREIVVRNGELYLATGGGLVIYDPSTDAFTKYDNVSGLPSNSLTSLVFGPSGALYVGTSDVGIAKIDLGPGRLTLRSSFTQEFSGLAGNDVRSVAEWNGNVVYGTASGAGTIVDDFPAATFTTTNTDSAIPSDSFRDVLPVGDNVWMATDGGLVVLDALGILHLPKGGPPSANVLGTGRGLVWVGTDDGVWTFDPSDSTWTNVGPLGSRHIHSLDYDGTTMRAGGTRNLWEYMSGNTWTQHNLGSIYVKYSLDGGLNEIAGLATMPDGTVYLGTGEGDIRKGPNLLRWDGSSFTDIVPNQPGGNDMARMSFDVNGSLWVSFLGFWVGKLTPSGTWVNYNSTIAASDSLTRQYANLTCLADSQGYKWFCSLCPYCVRPDTVRLDRLDDKLDNDYSNDEWRHYTIGDGGGDGLGSLALQNSTEDPAGNRWFLSSDDRPDLDWLGLQILSRDGSAWLQVKPSVVSQMPSGNVVDVAFAADKVYIALKTWGVIEWYPGGYDWADLSNLSDDGWVPRLRVGNELSSNAIVTSIALRDDGMIWVGTTEGVYGWSPATATIHIGQFNGFSNGITSPKVNDLALDHEGNLWVATATGLNRIARDDVNDIRAYSTAAEYQRTLSKQQYPPDVISPLVNAACNALALDPKRDILYIATAGGLSVLDFTPTQATGDLSRVYVYPNPVDASRGGTVLKIDNITGPVSVEIYNLEGELVSSSTAQAPGDVIWELTTADGYSAGFASGVYVVRIRSGDKSITRTVSVIR